jgi:hypothetical protein
MPTSYLRQSIRLQREPFESEIIEEVEKEFQRLEAERLGEDQGTERNVQDIAARVEDLEAKLEASNERLEAKIDASQLRLEAMFKELLASRAPIISSPSPISPRDNHPTVSVMLPIMADEPRNKEKVPDVASPKLTMQEVHDHIAQAVMDEGCASVTAQVEETLPPLGMDNAGTGAGPSSTVVLDHPEQVS